MAEFFIRVQLHLPGPDTYAQLHVAMEEAGFGRTVRNDGGATLHLPDAMYVCNGDFGAAAVRGYVVPVVNSVHPNIENQILVIESNYWAAAGLVEIQPPSVAKSSFPTLDEFMTRFRSSRQR